MKVKIKSKHPKIKNTIPITILKKRRLKDILDSNTPPTIMHIEPKQIKNPKMPSAKTLIE